MPMAFGSLIGGIVTLVGTSPNILVSRVREQLTGKPFEMFDFAPVGLAILIAGLAFLAVGWRLLPLGRAAPASAEDSFTVDDYLVEARLPEGSPFVRKTVAQLESLAGGRVTVIAIVREHGHRYLPGSEWLLFEDDVLVMHGDAHAIQEMADAAGLDVIGTTSSPNEAVSRAQRGVLEAVVMAGSRLIGCSPSELRLRDRFAVNLVAISRPGQPGHARLHDTRFQVGDVLILQGNTDDAQDVLKDLGCLPLVDRATRFGASRRDYLPLVILGFAVILVAMRLAPISAAFFGGAVLMVLTRILSLKEAYEALDPAVLVLLACLIPVSDAIAATGAAVALSCGAAWTTSLGDSMSRPASLASATQSSVSVVE